ncbi:hypothetical protein DdX_02892 [Ditylenchus destructor]|uniref:Uncharacterized protein n=1 Tax=Ditylenchus destructor TaxID=166010 RepID=A0AAD4NH02_9BILA|nr:hypothetical protein DdX_02892 [Ditylenchus destructor]
MVVLFNAQKGLWPPWPLVCVSKNDTHPDEMRHYARVRYAFTPIFICGWSVYLAVCPVVERPTEFGLRDSQFSSTTVKACLKN